MSDTRIDNSDGGPSNASRHKNKYSCDENISIHKYMNEKKMINDKKLGPMK